MQVVHTHSCGLDVHKRTAVACVLITHEDGTVTRQVRTFHTMTHDLLALSDWLDAHGVTHIAMESTGVYWQPIYNILEDGIRTILLGNAQHIKAVPGRKTDTKDSEWLADLLRHGLLHGSFIPPAAIRALRDLTRYRKSLVQERARDASRLHKILEGANIKLASVATNVLGVSGRRMLDAIVVGGNPWLAGIVLRAHGTSINPAPYLVADLGDFWTDCEGPGWPPGTVAPGECLSLGGLRVTRSHNTDPVVARDIAFYVADRGWHTWRVEVRNSRYRLLVDGKELEVATDTRPGSQIGTRFGFFLAFDPFFNNPRSMWIRRVTVYRLHER
jgi:hypothetical protein